MDESTIDRYLNHEVPANFNSDGCTMSPDKLPVIDWSWPWQIVYIDIREACVRHDYLRSSGLVTPQIADKILKRNMKELGVNGPWPHTYWTAVKWSRKLYTT